ncbi:helix-turn-helix transcriptional regulator [Candidatus Daviesbacteria bacterium]|nr:helix-turn-helix transcriptional regulator [Candidatus Daviesbacteria bacterium]
MGRSENKGERTHEGKPYQGTMIRELRHGVDKSLKEFAEEVGIVSASLSKIETNRARAGKELLSKIADKVGILGGELSKTPIHPRLIEIQRKPRQTCSLLSVGDQVNEMVMKANLLPVQLQLAEQLILDTSRAIILRLGVSNKP